MKSIAIKLLLIVGCISASAQSNISYTFDKLGRIKSEKIQNSYEMLFNYDKEGNIVSKVVTNITDLKPIRLDKDSEYKIYPNPTNSVVTIEVLTSNTNLDITVCDFSGKILDRKNSQQSITQFSLEKYPEGVYFLTLKSENKTNIHKIVKITR